MLHAKTCLSIPNSGIRMSLVCVIYIKSTTVIGIKCFFEWWPSLIIHMWPLTGPSKWQKTPPKSMKLVTEPKQQSYKSSLSCLKSFRVKLAGNTCYWCKARENNSLFAKNRTICFPTPMSSYMKRCYVRNTFQTSDTTLVSQSPNSALAL